MKPQFDVTIVSLKKAYALPHTWTADHYLTLLKMLEFYDTDDLEEADLAEMAVMALQDVEESAEAAEKVLELTLGDLTTKGIRQHLVHEMQEERAWEQHGDIMCHSQIFVAMELLNRAHPSLYAKPDVTKLNLEIVAKDGASAKLLAQPLTAAFLTRLLASAAGEHSALQRLFAEQIEGNQFPEATAIIWQIEAAELQKEGGHASRAVELYMPNHWVEPLKSVKQFEAIAHFDKS